MPTERIGATVANRTKIPVGKAVPVPKATQRKTIIPYAHKKSAHSSPAARKYTEIPKFLKICWWNFDRTKKQLLKFDGHPVLEHACKLGFWDGLTGRGGEFDPSRSLPAVPRFIFSLFK